MITTNRNQFIGAHLTPEADRALRQEVEKQRTTGGPSSISEYIYRLVVTDLRERGYSLPDRVEAI